MYKYLLVVMFLVIYNIIIIIVVVISIIIVPQSPFSLFEGVLVLGNTAHCFSKF